MIQPVAALGDDGYLHAQAVVPPVCTGSVRIAGWEISNDGRLFEPAHQSALLSDARMDGDQMRAQVRAGMYMLRPVLATTTDDQLLTTANVPVSISDSAAATLAKLRLPTGGTSRSAAVVGVTGVGAATSTGATMVGAGGRALMTAPEEGIPNPEVPNRLSQSLAGNQKITGPYSGANVNTGSSYSSGSSYNNPVSTATQTPAPATTTPVQATPPPATVGPQTAVPAGYVGGKLEASQGTVTGGIKLSWNLPPNNTYRYNVYRLTGASGSYEKLTPSPIGENGYLDPIADIAVHQYVVRSVVGDGTESSNSSPAKGYANAAPTATSAVLDAVKNKSSLRFDPKVTDPNLSAGQAEEFKIAIQTQPPTGQGTAVAVSNKLQWLPPADFSFVGETSFSYTLIDKGGEAVVGNAVVSVVFPPPPAPTGFTASKGTKTDQIIFMWQSMVGYAEYIATGYNIYNVDVVPPTKINASPILDTKFVYAPPTHASTHYQLRAITTVGESLATPPLLAWANAAIAAASAPNIIATAITASAPTPILIDDENLLLGQNEAFLVAIVKQPSVGVAKVSANGWLSWAPPIEHNFSGTVTFTFSVTDSGKASVVGLATVHVAPAASKGEITKAMPVTASGQTVAAALLCAKKFLLLGENTALSGTLPTQVKLTYMKNEEANCGGKTPLQTSFFVSTDKRTFVPLEKAAAFIDPPQIYLDSVTDSAQFSITKPGTFYFRVFSHYGNASVGSGIYRVSIGRSAR